MKVKQKNPCDEFICKSNFASIVGIIYVYMEDVLSCNFNIINEAIKFFIKQVKCLYHQKKSRQTWIEGVLKIAEDLDLQRYGVGKWEDHKPARVAEELYILFKLINEKQIL